MGMLHDQALHRLENPGPICCSTILNFKMQTESNCGKREPEKKNIARNEKQQKYNRKTLMKNTRKYIKKCFFPVFLPPLLFLRLFLFVSHLCPVFICWSFFAHVLSVCSFVLFVLHPLFKHFLQGRLLMTK